MAISNQEISNLPDYSDAELLKLYRWAMANGAAGTTRTINNRTIEFPSLPDLTATIAWLEQRIAASSSSGGIAVARFREVS